MKLVIDLQGAQSASRHRGIGRYSLALARAMARCAGSHELWIVLSGAFSDTIEPLRASFENLVPQEQILVWGTPTPVDDVDPANGWRRRTGEILRESFLASLKPDMVHVSSLFEGAIDDAITSVGRLTNGLKTAVTLYDLIPLIKPDPYLSNPEVNAHYQRKLASLRRAGLWLSISESSRREGIDWLDLPPDKIVNVSAATDAHFRRVRIGDQEERAIRQRYGLTRPFVMFTGATDPRKNLNRLFGAYRRLPAALRRDHQLLIVCPAQDWEVAALKEEAQRQGFTTDEIVIAPFVPDNELVALYNLCAVFCFPSLLEGFGLPALEAMQCGAAVIGSNVSSIPEVVGRKDALFDPYDEHDIAERLHQVLTDADYRQSLIKHGRQQARKFTWEESARRAWAALAAHHDEVRERTQTRTAVAPTRRPRLAYVSPLPPERSGIANYSAELLPELDRHYDIDVIVNQKDVSDSWITANCPIRDVAWFNHNAHSYDRIFYHFGNSPFHKHMFDLLERHPGTVLLHDFYLSGVTAYLEIHEGWQGFWAHALYWSHGYSALLERAKTGELAEIVYKYPVNLSVLQNAQGVVVHSNYSRDLAGRFYGENFAADWAIVPPMRRLPQTGGREAARKALGFGAKDFVLCSFGIMDATKLNHHLLRAWLDSKLADDRNCHLVFVGEEQGGDYGAELRRIIGSSPARKRVRITGFVSPELYRQYLCAADAAAQLRSRSRGETSRAVLDCMAHALPTIANAHASMAELPEDCVVMLPDEFSVAELGAALEELRADPVRRKALGEKAQSYVKESLSPRAVADQCQAAIEQFATRSQQSLIKRTLSALAAVDPEHRDEREWLDLARAVNRNTPVPRPQRQLLVDVSANVATDLKTGIERVVQAQLLELLRNPPPGFRTEPVYLTKSGGSWHYRYARAYAARLLGLDGVALKDEPCDVAAGDLFFSPDYFPYGIVHAAEIGLYADWRARGVRTSFVVYDILPITRPDCFPDYAAEMHANWISCLAKSADQLICISAAVAEETKQWLNAHEPKALEHLKITSLHLGADICSSGSSKSVPEDAASVLATLSSRPTFLMVGTIEPRKAHLLTLVAFEQLWRVGVDANLVIVGREGWKGLPDEQRRTIPEIVKRLRDHPELGKRLFWLEGISDEHLEEVYAASNCLIAASEGEGFGLPLIEAARHKLPILARDIPVFREVAGGHASYFSGSDPDALAHAIRDWLELYAENRHPKSDDMPWLNWAQSAERLKVILLADDLSASSPHRESAAETAKRGTSSPGTAAVRIEPCRSSRGRNRLLPSSG